MVVTEELVIGLSHYLLTIHIQMMVTKCSIVLCLIFMPHTYATYRSSQWHLLGR